jgi:hypothetical protein
MVAQTSEKQMAGVVAVTNTAIGHRVCLTLLSVLLTGSAIALLVYGWDYYLLDLTQRPFSSEHAYLKPSGIIGLRLGIFGMILFALVYLYPLRKYWPAFGRIGKTRNWFDYHIFLGIMTPTVVTFHSAFKHDGFAGMAYWTMIALVGSGIIGRYFYAQIPRNISAAEMSLQEMQDLKTSLLEELKLQKTIQLSEIEALFRLPDSRKIQSISALRAVIQMVMLDIVRPFRVWALRRRGLKSEGYSAFGAGILRSGNVELEKAIHLASMQAALSKRILFLSKTHQLFHGWHVIHRPFSISVAIFVAIHYAVMLWLGYY